MTAVLKSEMSGATVRGHFYARVAPTRDRAQLRFNLTYSPSAGSAFDWPYRGFVHIHLGSPTQPGPTAIELCNWHEGRGRTPCGFGFVWSESFPFDLLGRMRTRGAYVELHPRRAPRSDVLRGQLEFR